MLYPVASPPARERVILEGVPFELTLERLCYQLIEQHGNFSESCVLGIQPRGILLANRISRRLAELLPETQILFGKLDVTFNRDDFRLRNEPLTAHATEIDFLVHGKRVVLVDDVLYSGRTIRAALDALQNYGRPAQVELLTLVNRRFSRDMPVQAQYVGIAVDALNDTYVRVEWRETHDADRVLLLSRE